MSLHDLVGKLQKEFMGHDLGSLSLLSTPAGLVARPTRYAAKLPDDDARAEPGQTAFLRSTPRRAEHFLQTVRDSYPGVSFQLLMVTCFKRKIFVRHAAA